MRYMNLDVQMDGAYEAAGLSSITKVNSLLSGRSLVCHHSSRRPAGT